MHTTTYQATSPVRICDLGGWSDTWFAGHGQVCSIAVAPGVEATLTLAPRADATQRVTLVAANYDETLAFPAATTHHPHLHAALQTYPVPPQWDAVLTVSSDIPPGASTGTSAALCVAVIGVLRAARGETTDPATLARLAHELETHILGWQSGVQDQCGAAFGGCVWIDMPVYPQTVVTPVALSAETRAALDAQLLLFYIGTPHRSSDIHRQVIDRFESTPDAAALLVPLRAAALAGKTALARGDLEAYGAALRDNTVAQRALHPLLLCATAESIIAIATAQGALGCKVNGAAGDGGTVAVLASPDPAARAALCAAVEAIHPSVRRLPVSFAPDGVHIRSVTT